jgi:RNA recognition motif-containing protein
MPGAGSYTGSPLAGRIIGVPGASFAPNGPAGWLPSFSSLEAIARALGLVEKTLVGKKLYVGNLSYSVSSSDLEQMFAAFGMVRSAEIIGDRDSGRSKGFGFVEMSNDHEAQAAIQGLNGKEHDGRSLAVNEARPREERSGGGGGREGRGGHGGRGGRY